MRSVLLALVLMATLAGAAAAIVSRPLPIYPHLPLRPAERLGEVSVLSIDRPAGPTWTEHHARPLAAAARAGFGRDVQALVAVRHEALPNGSGVRTTATAVRWSKNAR